jgi:hypothetical protein
MNPWPNTNRKGAAIGLPGAAPFLCGDCMTVRLRWCLLHHALHLRNWAIRWAVMTQCEKLYLDRPRAMYASPIRTSTTTMMMTQ